MASRWRWWRWARPAPAAANCMSPAGSSSTANSSPAWCCRKACACCCIAIWNRGFRRPSWWAGEPKTVPRVRPLIEQVQQRKRAIGRTLGSGAGAETFHALPLTGYQDDLLGVLLIASSRRELVELESVLRRTGMGVAAAGILLGIALSWWATARVTRPVQRLAESAARVAAGDWGATVESPATDEIGQLARAFNRMTHELVAQRERLVQAERVAAWRELARRLAHELKNPLFPLQITVENMQRARERYPEQFDEVFREGAATLLAELANLKQIIARFSDFAKMPAPEMQPVNFNELVSETLKLFEPQLAQARVRADAAARPAPAPRPGRPGADDPRPAQPDPERHRRHARGRNAHGADHRPRGRRAPGGFRYGPGPHARGVRGACSRRTTPPRRTAPGLGLAIVQSVVSDHHGRNFEGSGWQGREAAPVSYSLPNAGSCPIGPIHCKERSVLEFSR